MKSQK